MNRARTFSRGEFTQTECQAVQRRARQLGSALAVFAVAVATFLPALHNGLLGDDVLLLEERLHEGRAPGLAGFFRESYWGDLHQSALYRPLSLALLSAERRAFGRNPAAYRAANLILHGLCSILVLHLLGRFVPPSAAFGGALLFAVHPIHAEAVTTIYGQQDLLAALFFLAATVTWFRSSARGPSSAGVALVGSLYLLSLLSKEQGVLLPVLFALLRLRPTARQYRPALLERRDLALAVPLGIYALLRLQALGTAAVPGAEASVAYGYPWWARLNLVIVTVGTYLRLLVLPWGQTTYYGHLRDSLFGLPFLEFVALTGAVTLFRPLQRALGHRVVWTAFSFLAVTLLPVANLLPIGVVVGERCLYLPTVSVCLLAAVVAVRAAGARPGLRAAALCAIVVVGMVLSTRVAFRWRTPLIHWETTAADHPRSGGAHARFALLLLHDTAQNAATRDDAALARAEEAIGRAMQINERLPDAWQARGRLAIMRGDCAAAIPALEHALRLRPDDRHVATLLKLCR